MKNKKLIKKDLKTETAPFTSDYEETWKEVNEALTKILEDKRKLRESIQGREGIEKFLEEIFLNCEKLKNSYANWNKNRDKENQMQRIHDLNQKLQSFWKSLQGKTSKIDSLESITKLEEKLKTLNKRIN